MAWTKTGWSDLIGSSATKTLLAAAGASSGSIICYSGANHYVTMDTMIYYGASTAASKATVEWLGWNHAGASLVDTVAYYTVELIGVNAASVKATYSINVSGMDGIKVQVTNNEDTDGASFHAAAMFGYA